MLRFLTAGESHGKGLTVIIEGMPAGLPLDEEYIAVQLRRRQWGYGRGGRMRIEQDWAEITAGVRHGRTIGSPIALWIRNRDWENWQEVMSITPPEAEVAPVTRLRPGHADLTGAVKYGHRDVRNVIERASARETAARVAAGTVARRLLEEFGMQFRSHTVQIGPVKIDPERVDWSRVEESPVRCGDPVAEAEMVEAINAAKRAHDTVGGVFEVIATGVPIGLGSYAQWDRKLDGLIAQAMLSINAAKAVEFGGGFALAGLPGSQVHDVIEAVDHPTEPGRKVWRHRTNRAGGIVGGISNGEPIVVRVAIKPIPTLANPLPSADLLTGEPILAPYERSDVCVVPAAGVIGEAMLAWVLAVAFLEKFGGDHIDDIRASYEHYLRRAWV